MRTVNNPEKERIRQQIAANTSAIYSTNDHELAQSLSSANVDLHRQLAALPDTVEYDDSAEIAAQEAAAQAKKAVLDTVDGLNTRINESREQLREAERIASIHMNAFSDAERIFKEPAKYGAGRIVTTEELAGLQAKANESTDVVNGLNDSIAEMQTEIQSTVNNQ